MRDFKGKVAVVTGGASGIGRSLVKELLQAGAKVVIGDVEQFLSVLVGADHIGRYEAGPGVVALVPQSPVELERVTDGLVDLQDHLVGCQKHIHRPARAVGCREELHRLFGEARCGITESGPTE